jgi:hypothetical protein
MNLSAKKEHIFEETCVYEAVGSLSVMPSLHFSLMFSEGEVKSLYLINLSDSYLRNGLHIPQLSIGMKKNIFNIKNI